MASTPSPQNAEQNAEQNAGQAPRAPAPYQPPPLRHQPKFVYSRYGKGSRVGYEMLRTFLRLLVFPLGRLRTEGLENIPTEGPVLIASNHNHWTDIPFLSLRPWRITHYMAKAELFRVPILGWVMTKLGTFPVRRGERDRDSLKLAESILSMGEIVVVFPEGHRSEDSILQVGHPGVALIALHTGVPVVPVAIEGTDRVLKGMRIGPFRPTVTVHYGKPFRLRSVGKRVTRDELARGTEVIMGNIAALLPPERRGPYTQLPPHITSIPGGDGIPSIEFNDEPEDTSPPDIESGG